MKLDRKPTPRELVGLLVWFANAKISSTAHVEAKYMKVTRLTPDTFKEIRPQDVDAYRSRLSPPSDQQQAKDWLLNVIAFDKKSPAEQETLRRAVSKIVEAKISKRPRPTFGKHGFVVEWETTQDGVELTNAYTVCLLLGDSMLRRRVGICGLEECERFFFDNRVHGGAKQAYCSHPKHSETGRKRRQRLGKVLERKTS